MGNKNIKIKINYFSLLTCLIWGSLILYVFIVCIFVINSPVLSYLRNYFRNFCSIKIIYEINFYCKLRQVNMFSRTKLTIFTEPFTVYVLIRSGLFHFKRNFWFSRFSHSYYYKTFYLSIAVYPKLFVIREKRDKRLNSFLTDFKKRRRFSIRLHFFMFVTSYLRYL